MTQIRKTHSKRKIREALFFLLSKNSFDKISITDITRLASINRGTFYLHYIDKFDLIEQIVGEVKGELYTILLVDQDNVDSALYHSLTYLKTEQEHIHILDKSGALDLSEEIEAFLKELLRKNLDFQSEIINHHSISKEYLMTSFYGGITAIITNWLKQGCQQEPKEIALVLQEIRSLYTKA